MPRALIVVFVLFASGCLGAQEAKPGRVTIWVSSEQARAIEGAVIEVKPASGDSPFKVTTTSVGGVAFELPAGGYSFSASVKGFKQWNREIAVSSGVNQSIQAILLRTPPNLQGAPDVVIHSTPGPLAVTVTDTIGAVVPGADVSLNSVSSGARTTKLATADGTAEFDAPPGKYKILVSMKGFQEWTRPIDIVEGESQSITAVLQVGKSECEDCFITAGPDLPTTAVDFDSSLPIQALEQFPLLSVRPRHRFL